MADFSKDLMAASSIPLILSILSEGESYGYEIIKKIKAASGGKLAFAEGTLYPILKKMEEKGWIESQWKAEGNERPRKYYFLKEEGKTTLATEKENWLFISQILHNLWNQQQNAPSFT
ncbi:MAG: PadR family transcriptional regulator [Bacteroidia bacterium]